MNLGIKQFGVRTGISDSRLFPLLGHSGLAVISHFSGQMKSEQFNF